MKPPAMPRSHGEPKTPVAMAEVMNSAPSRSPISVSGVVAPARSTPRPARIRGLLAARSSPAMRSRSSVEAVKVGLTGSGSRTVCLVRGAVAWS